MGEIARVALTITGTVIGSYFGFPQLGALAGGLLGSVLFPVQLPTLRGPKLDDLSVQSSALGVPVPIVWGTFRVAGNIIWSTDLVATTSSESVGGKGGGGQKVETTTYSVSFAVGLCNNVITGIRRIWAGGKLIYDRRAQLPDESTDQYNDRLDAADAFDVFMAVYLGTDDQLPDPTIESHEGVGNVPGYRQLAYVVLREFQLADYGNNLAGTLLSFEVVVGGAFEFHEVLTESSKVVFPWGASLFDPYSLRNDHTFDAFFSRVDHTMTVRNLDHSGLSTLAAALASVTGDTTLDPSGHAVKPVWPDEIVVSAYGSRGTDDVESPLGKTNVTGADSSTALKWVINQFYFPQSPSTGSDYYFYHSDDDGTMSDFLSALGKVAGTVVYVDGDIYPSLWKKFASAIGAGNDPIWQWDGPNSSFQEPDSGGGIWYKCDPIVIKAYRVPRAPDNPCAPQGLLDPPDSEIYPGFCIVDGRYVEDQEWVEHTGQNDLVESKMLQRYNQFGRDEISFPPGYREQVGPLLKIGDPDYDNAAFWEARYAEAVLADTMPAGMVYGGGYPVYPTDEVYYELTNQQSFLSADTVTLAVIVADLCRRSGLSDEQFNVEQLTQLVPGYAVGRIMDAASAIQPLRLYGFFDMVESDGVLKFIVRGGLEVATLEDDDLGAHEADGERPASVDVTRAQDVDLPRALRVKYLMLDKDYEPGGQVASRQRTTADQIIDVELAMALPDVTAAQIADIGLYEAWIGRNTYNFALAQQHMALEPTDPVLLPVDGSLHRVRILGEDFAIPGIKQLQAVRDGGASAYSSYVAGGSPLISEQILRLLDSTIGFYLDLPMLRDAHNEAGYYVGLRQINDTGNWPNAAALRSADGGANYFSIGTATAQVVTGLILDPLPAGETTVIDSTNVLQVTLDLQAPTLESISIETLLVGGNAAVIGSDGRWEIIQFQEAELTPASDGNTWLLSGLVRGRRGTEYVMGTSMAGDQFVLLGNVIRTTQEIAAIGAERLLKALTSGQPLDASAAVLFTGNGEALRPISPVLVEGERDLSDNLTITWVRRTRFGQELPGGGVDLPLGEASEAYDVDVLDGLTVVRTVTVTSPSWVYSAANQTTDFGSPPSSVTIRVFQLSAVVGRGHAAEAVL